VNPRACPAFILGGMLLNLSGSSEAVKPGWIITAPLSSQYTRSYAAAASDLGPDFTTVRLT
jgi:hypothetical protein